VTFQNDFIQEKKAAVRNIFTKIVGTAKDQELPPPTTHYRPETIKSEWHQFNEELTLFS
jgi:hypothetical protein